jgi:aspartyl protease family protein
MIGNTISLLWVVVAVVAAAVVALILNDSASLIPGLRNGEAAQIIIAVTALVVVSAGLVGRGPFGRAVRYSLTWVLLLLAAVGAYTYRQEIEWVGRRMVAELAPGTALVDQKSPSGAPHTVQVKRAAGGHFRVEASINGMGTTMLVDTGASVVTLTRDDALAAGIDIDTLTYSVPVFTANGTTRAAPVIIDELKVGPIERRRVPALVAQPGLMDRSLLGMSFLDTLGSYTISGDTLTLMP